MMWSTSSSFTFLQMDHLFISREAVPGIQALHSGNTDGRLPTKTPLSDSDVNLQQFSAVELDVLETSPSRSPWLEYFQETASEIANDTSSSEIPQIADSWGQFEFFEKVGSRPAAPDVTLEKKSEAVDPIEDEEKDDQMLIFQLEL
jgi:hypothetical protein